MNKFLPGLAIAAALFSFDGAEASQILGPPVAAATVGGILSDFNWTPTGEQDTAVPWTAEVYSEAHQCLRLAVLTLSKPVDLIMTVVAPNGQVYRDDDSGGDRKPLVRIADAPNKGYYAVRVSTFFGNQVNASFAVRFQRLSLNNSACMPATPKLVNGTSP